MRCCHIVWQFCSLIFVYAGYLYCDYSDLWDVDWFLKISNSDWLKKSTYRPVINCTLELSECTSAHLMNFPEYSGLWFMTLAALFSLHDEMLLDSLDITLTSTSHIYWKFKSILLYSNLLLLRNSEIMGGFVFKRTSREW